MPSPEALFATILCNDAGHVLRRITEPRTNFKKLWFRALCGIALSETGGSFMRFILDVAPGNMLKNDMATLWSCKRWVMRD